MHYKIQDILGVLLRSAWTLKVSDSHLCLHLVNGYVLDKMNFQRFLFGFSNRIPSFLDLYLFCIGTAYVVILCVSVGIEYHRVSV